MTTITEAGGVPHPALISGRHYKKIPSHEIGS